MLSGCLQKAWIRYFWKPLRGPPTHGVRKPPATKKENQKNPKTPIIPKSKRSFPKSRRSFPKSKRSFPKSKRSLFLGNFWRIWSFWNFLLGGSRSQGFRKYLKHEHPQGFCRSLLHAVDCSLLVSLKTRKSLFKTHKIFPRHVCRRFGGDNFWYFLFFFLEGLRVRWSGPKGHLTWHKSPPYFLFFLV